MHMTQESLAEMVFHTLSLPKVPLGLTPQTQRSLCQKHTRICHKSHPSSRVTYQPDKQLTSRPTHTTKPRMVLSQPLMQSWCRHSRNLVQSVLQLSQLQLTGILLGLFSMDCHRSVCHKGALLLCQDLELGSEEVDFSLDGIRFGFFPLSPFRLPFL